MDKYGLKIENNFSQLNAELTKMIANLREISEKCQKGIELNMKSDVNEKLQEQKALYEALNIQIKRQADLQKQLFNNKDGGLSKQLEKEIELIKERIQLTQKEISNKGLESAEKEIVIREKLNQLYTDSRLMKGIKDKIEADKISEESAKKELEREQKKIDKKRELTELQKKYNEQYLELSKKEEKLKHQDSQGVGEMVKKEIDSQLSSIKSQKNQLESLVREMKGLSIRDMKNYSKTGLVDVLNKNKLETAKKGDADEEKRILEARKLVYSDLSKKLQEINSLKIKSISLDGSELELANEKLRQLRIERDKLNDKRNNKNIKTDVDEEKLLNLKEKLESDFNNAFVLESKKQYEDLLDLQDKSLNKELEIMKLTQREKGAKDTNIDYENRLETLKKELDVIQQQVKAKKELVDGKYKNADNEDIYNKNKIELDQKREKEVYAWKGRQVESLHAANAKILDQEKSKLNYLNQQISKGNLTVETEQKLLTKIEQSKNAVNELITKKIKLENIGETGALSLSKQAEAQEHLNRLIEKETLLKERSNEKNRIAEATRVSKLGTKVDIGKPIDLGTSINDVKKFAKELYGAGAEVDSFKNKTDKAGNQVKEFSVKVADSNGNLRTHKLTLDDTTKSFYSLETGARQTEGAFARIKNGFGDLVKGLSVFELMKTGIRELGQELKRSFSYIVEVDTAEADLQVVTGKSKEEVDGLAQSYGDLANKLHESKLNMVEGATEFLRAGLNESQINDMLQVSTMASKIAGENQKEVAEKLIAIMNGFKIEASDMMGYADKMVYMGNATATSFGEISAAIQRTANSAQLAGSDFDHLVAYISSMSETTRQSAETIGNSMKTMYSRFQDVKGGKDFDAESGEAISNVESALNRQGIALRDSVKEFRNYDEVISEIASKWKNFDDIAKSDISKALAGTRQREFFVVMMENYDKIIQYQKDMQGSLGSTENAYNSIADRLQFKIQDFKNAVGELREKIVSSGLAEKVVDTGTKIIKTIDDIITKHGDLIGSILKGLAGYAALKLSIAGLNGLLNPFKTDIEGVTGSFNILATVLGSGSIVGGLKNIISGFVAFKGVLLALNPVIAGIGIAITVLGATLGYAASKRKEEQEGVEKLSESYRSLKSDIIDGNGKEATKQYSSLKKQEDELISKIKERGELTRRINLAKSDIGQPSDPNFKTKNSDFNKMVTQQKALNKEIEDNVEQLTKAGLTIDENTGKVKELHDAYKKINEMELSQMSEKAFEGFDEKIEYTIQHRDEIVRLIDEYNRLMAVEDADGFTKHRLDQVTNELTQKVGGLITATDEHGKMTIVNDGILQNHIGWLNTEGMTHEELAKVVAQEANDYLSAQSAKTETAKMNTQQRLAMYEAEALALSAYQASLAEQLTQKVPTQKRVGPGKWITVMETPIVAEGMKPAVDKRLAEVKASIAEIKNAQNIVGGMGGGGVGASSSTGYMPSGGGSSSGGGKGSNGSSATEREYTTNIELLDKYEMRLTRINEVLTVQKDKLDALNRERDKFQAMGYEDDKEHYAIGKKMQQYDSYISQVKNEQRVLTNIQNDIRKEFKSFSGLDIAQYSKIQLEKIYSDKYGGERSFKDEASQKAFEKQAEIFKNLIEQWDEAKDQSKDLVEELHSAEVEKLNLIKEYWDKAFEIQQNRLNKYTDKIEEMRNKLDTFDLKVDVDNLDATQTEERKKLIEDIKKQSLEYKQVLIEQTSWLEAQKLKLKEGSQEWEAVHQKIKENNKEILNISSSIKDLDDSVKNIKDKSLNLVKSIEDRIIALLRKKYEEIIKKEEERHKSVLDNLEKERKAQIDIIDLKLKSMEKEKNEEDYNKQLNNKLEEKAKIQAQYDSLSMDNSLEANAKKQELLEQLKDKDKEIVDMQEKYAYDKRKENLENQKDVINKEYDERKKKLEKEFTEYKKTLEKKLELDSLYAESKKALMDGFFIDAEGNIKNLSDALLEYEDKFGEGLSVLGDKIKKEIIDNLLKVQELIQNGFDWGASNEDIKNPNKDKDKNQTKDGMTIYGNETDIANAKSVIDKIEKETGKKLNVKFGSVEDAKNNIKDGDIVLGGAANDYKDNDKITGITGSDRYDTANKLESFLTGKKKKLTILGRGVDIANAKDLVNKLGVYAEVIDLDKTPRSPRSGDIVLGGEAAKYPISSGIIKLTGNDRYQTKDMLEKYLTNIKGYSNGGVIDYTGLAMVHGGNSPEVVLNSSQIDKAHKVYEFLSDNNELFIPKKNGVYNQSRIAKEVLRTQANSFGFNFEKLINIEGNVDKDVIPELKKVAGDTLNELRREFNKRGIY